ncbi:MAG: DHHA1 domain-containing protein [Ilumatobacteraceae bacterium]
MSTGDLRELAIAVRQQPSVTVVVLAGATDTGGVALAAAVAPETGLVAADLLRDAAKLVGGGGGGKGDVATAGGKDPRASTRRSTSPGRRRAPQRGDRSRATGRARARCASISGAVASGSP